jgi:hypothetical protein
MAYQNFMNEPTIGWERSIKGSFIGIKVTAHPLKSCFNLVPHLNAKGQLVKSDLNNFINSFSFLEPVPIKNVLRL